MAYWKGKNTISPVKQEEEKKKDDNTKSKPYLKVEPFQKSKEKNLMQTNPVPKDKVKLKELPK